MFSSFLCIIFFPNLSNACLYGSFEKSVIFYYEKENSLPFNFLQDQLITARE